MERSAFCFSSRLNEGITTYLERKIVGKLHGEQERHLHAMGKGESQHVLFHSIHYPVLLTLNQLSLADGWKALIDAVSLHS